MSQLMQVTILLPGTIWSAFVQFTLTQDGSTLTVVPNNSGQQSFGCNLSFIIFSWSKCFLRSDSHKFGITLSASFVAVIIVEVVVDNFNPKKFINARLWTSYILHSSIESIKSPQTVRRMLALSSYKTASGSLLFTLGESICFILWSHLTVARMSKCQFSVS